jgi:hypothetical protein
MPAFSNGERVMGAPEGSFLADALISEGWVAEGSPTPAEPTDDLKGLKRGELDSLAADLGVDSPEDLPNAEAVKDAIRTAEQEADNG